MSPTEAEGLERLRIVLERLTSAGFSLKIKEMFFPYEKDRISRF